MRILVVDDEAVVRELLKRVLASHGHEVMEAENGLQGLQVAKCQPCDLVITDQKMPLLNGLDMISRLAAERYPARYLLISGYGADLEVPSHLPFLSKPFTSSQLLLAVERLQQEPTLAELERAWKAAKEEWQRSFREATEILSDVPSETPHRDELLIERTELQQRTTYELYSQAFRKYKQALQGCGVLGAITEKSGPEGKTE